MKITIDTEKGIFIVPNSFFSEIEKQNTVLRNAGITDADKLITAEKILDSAFAEAKKRPILTAKQAKDWNSDLEKQTL
jgi:hypothetical protein